MSNHLVREFGERLVPLVTGASGIRSMLQVKVSPNPEDEDLLTMRASDETLDRYQEVISANGWKLDNYRRNPVIQNAHQYGDVTFTIGKAVITTVQNGALIQIWKFASRENPAAKIARDLYRGGFLNASSVGFAPIRWENGSADSPYKRKYTEQELLEVSAVGIPANPSALVLGIKSGAVDPQDVKELAGIMNHICNNKAGLKPLSTTQGTVADGAELLKLARELQQVLRRI